MGIQIHCDFCELRVDLPEEMNTDGVNLGTPGYMVLLNGSIWCMHCDFSDKT